MESLLKITWVGVLIAVIAVVIVIDVGEAKKDRAKDAREEEAQALQGDIENGISPIFIMPRLMDLLHQVSRVVSCPECQTKRGCWGSGGKCQKSTTSCNGTTVEVGCPGEDCECCIPFSSITLGTNRCRSRRSCRQLSGTCMADCDDCISPQFIKIYSGCKGNCFCCAPSTRFPPPTFSSIRLTTFLPSSSSSSFEPTTHSTGTVSTTSHQYQRRVSSPSSSSIIIGSGPSFITPSSFETTTVPQPGSASSSSSSSIPVRCAPDFFPLGDECFRVIEETSTWVKAEPKCLGLGSKHVFLAEPTNSSALAQYMFNNGYSREHHYWMGGRGDGISIKWRKTGLTIGPSEPWEDGQPSDFSRNLCLDLRIDFVTIPLGLTKPLAVHTCSQSHLHCYICESSLRL